ncbi:MAG: inorganic phosphate transporter [Saprospiraceae bacterium]|nr:inorganic phosphate transporter [Saprospiraceae bacterium]
METIYLILIIVLGVLAISDLIVGVSNDAVNFVNSAIGSKAFKFNVVMSIAAAGVVVGAIFSSGMMEVARSGIFNPQHFYFSEVIIIFLAVMITDVILLDLFNTFGLPTSTTVSVVFELLGASVGIAILKIMNQPDHLPLIDYINSEKTIVIVMSILLSVAIAFTFGAIGQYLSRLLFSFDYKRKLKYFGAIWGAIAITGITFFILVKGAKDMSFMTDDLKSYIKDNSFLIMLYCFAFWAIILQLIIMFTKFDILKLVVIFGTFALALAFAGNDLVNFIGVPLAGLESYKLWLASGADVNLFTMEGLAGDVETPGLLLLLAGVIMAVTLFVNKKARTVTETEVGLGRQEEGYERFGSSALSRSVVRGSTKMGKTINNYLPGFYKRFTEKQFDRSVFVAKQQAMGKNAPSFDLLRAAVILASGSIIISVGTSYKLPLSTTYVTFMVAMGASLADGAWGRETAVYRITGVLSVIGGWFLTAFFAFTSAFLLAFLFYYGSYAGIFVMVAITAFLVYRTHAMHKKKEEEKVKKAEEEETEKIYTVDDVRNKNLKNFRKFSEEINQILDRSVDGLDKEDLKMLSKNYKKYSKLLSESEEKQSEINKVINRIPEKDIEISNYYTINLYYLREIIQSLKNITWETFHHVDNNHKPLMKAQVEELQEAVNAVKGQVQGYVNFIQGLPSDDFDDKHEAIIELFNKLRSNQIKRVKNKTAGNRNSVLYFGFIGHLRSIINFTKRLQLIETNFRKQNQI